MIDNWVQKLASIKQVAPLFKRANSKVATAYYALRDAQHATGVLDAKTRELIALAVAATTHCDGCIASHVAAAHKAGATLEEVGEALGTAIALNAGSTYVYSLRVQEAFEQMAPAKAVG
jgi:AhpD family alkylhydroperoxidase